MYGFKLRCLRYILTDMSEPSTRKHCTLGSTAAAAGQTDSRKPIRCSTRLLNPCNTPFWCVGICQAERVLEKILRCHFSAEHQDCPGSLLGDDDKDRQKKKSGEKTNVKKREGFIVMAYWEATSPSTERENCRTGDRFPTRPGRQQPQMGRKKRARKKKMERVTTNAFRVTSAGYRVRKWKGEEEEEIQINIFTQSGILHPHVIQCFCTANK